MKSIIEKCKVNKNILHFEEHVDIFYHDGYYLLLNNLYILFTHIGIFSF